MKQLMQWSLVTLAIAGAGWASTPSDGTAAQPVDRAAATNAISHADAARAVKLAADKQVVVLDIRTPKEFEAGHIQGATNVDYYAKDFEKRLGELDKSKTYLLHCASGNRSIRALPLFQKLQFQSLIHLDGGFKAWSKAGNPIVK